MILPLSGVFVVSFAKMIKIMQAGKYSFGTLDSTVA